MEAAGTSGTWIPVYHIAQHHTQ